MKHRNLKVLWIALMLALPHSDARACVNQDLGLCSKAGEIEWDGTNKFYTYCDGTSKIAMQGVGTDGACTTESEIQYDTGDARLEYCNGTNWVPSTSATSIGSCAAPGEQQLNANGYMAVCDGTELRPRLSTNTLTAAPSGLIGHWKFDELSGTSAADSSTGGNAGTLTNMDGATDWVSGKNRNALDFDGSDDYVDLGTSTVSLGDIFSICAWVNVDDLDDTQNIVIRRNSSGANTGNPELQLNIADDGSAGWAIWPDTGGSAIVNISSSASAITADSWHHICGSHGGNGENSALYIDGTQVATTAVSGTIRNTGQPLQIGVRTNNTSSRYMDGQLDDVQIYDRVLSPEEVSYLYNAGGAQYSAAPTDGLVGYWKFDEGTGSSVAVDSTGNQADATFSNIETGTDWVTGQIGDALELDSTDDRVNILDDDTLDFGTGDFTVSAWINPVNGSGDHRYLLHKGANTGVSGFRFGTNVGKPYFLLADTTGNVGPTITGGDTIASNEWSLLTIVFDRDVAAKGYINGQYIGQDTTITTKQGSIDNTDRIFMRPYITGSTNITADDVRIYNRALSDTEINNLYLATGGTPDLGTACADGTLHGVSNLVGHWKLDETSGTTANDVLGLNDGTMVGGLDAGTDSVAGQDGTAIDFDGVGDYIDFGTYVPDAQTIAYWLKINGTGNGPIVYAGTDSFNSANWDWSSFLLSGDLRFRGNAGGGGSILSFTTAEWFHIVQVRDNGSGSHHVYKNGVLSIDDFNSSTIETAGRYLRIAKSSTSYTDIDLDDIRIYDRALNANEIKALYLGTGGN